MFWTVLLLTIVAVLFGVPALFYLEAMFGGFVYTIAGILLVAGAISAVAGAHQKIMNRLDQVEKKLDQLQEMRNDHDEQ